jgi:capsular polysaccharide biosynthesis protein
MEYRKSISHKFNVHDKKADDEKQSSAILSDVETPRPQANAEDVVIEVLDESPTRMDEPMPMDNTHKEEAEKKPTEEQQPSQIKRAITNRPSTTPPDEKIAMGLTVICVFVSLMVGLALFFWELRVNKTLKSIKNNVIG